MTKKIIDEQAVLRSLSLPNLVYIWHLSTSPFRAASPRCSVARRGWWPGVGGVGSAVGAPPLLESQMVLLSLIAMPARLGCKQLS